MSRKRYKSSRDPSRTSTGAGALDWKPWMTVALVFSGIVAVATYVGPRPAGQG